MAKPLLLVTLVILSLIGALQSSLAGPFQSLVVLASATAFALSSLKLKAEDKMPRTRPTILKKLGWSLLATVLVLITALNFLNLAAGTLFAIGSAKGEEGISFKEMAARLNPRLDLYPRELAKDYLHQALAYRKEANQRDQAALYVKKSLLAARTAISLNRWEAQNYRVAALIYTDLIGTVSGAAAAAQGYLNQAIDLNPNDPQLRLDLARLYSLTGREEDAITYLNEAIRLKSGYTEAHYQLARILARLKRYSQAEEEYRLALNSLSNRQSPLFQEIEEEMLSFMKFTSKP